MRPVRLELEGFTAFRDRTVIDFAGADLFALVGPTGAGKTSVIDAMTFALYGSVPRLGEKLVAPVLSQGLVEAKVRFDFTVAGVPHTVVRVVRATTRTGGATTKEARLERDGEQLAGDAGEVTARVVELLGLDFRQFTTCVSLPQGEFARFLHEEPRKRGDLLVRLLDLGLYDLVAAAARQRHAMAAERAALAEQRLAQLAGATAAAVDAAAARVGELAAVRDRLDAAQAELDALSRAADEAERLAIEGEAAVALLTAVAVPAGVDDLASALTSANEAYERVRTAEAEATEALTKAEAALDGLPSRSMLERAHHDHDELARLTTLVDTGRGAVVSAQEAATKADAALAQATNAYNAARTADLAHALAAELQVGEPCPVCAQIVTEVHRRAAPELAAAKQAFEKATKAAAAGSNELARVDEKLANVTAQRDEIAGRLADAPPADALAARLREVTAAEAEVADAKQAAAGARRQRDEAERAVDHARRAEQQARVAFDEARDRVAALGPPPAGRTDLAVDWAALTAWAADRAPELEVLVGDQRAVATERRDAQRVLLAALVAACAAVGVDAGQRPRDDIVDALARAEADHRQVVADVAEAEQLRASVQATVDDASVAKALADHLAANRFEQWLLDSVLRQLTAGATVLLRDLSGGAYSLVLDHKSRAFAVVDHINADAARSARTLSGGETFLASLALALALADQVALVAGSAARLETILLDEGFGTLDADTLEVVAAALEELGARGRMVGVVTHVHELADRLPVRYEVSKVAGAATVARIDR